MENIGEGDYVRTNLGIIDKIKEIKTVKTKMDGNHDISFKLEKHSNIYIKKYQIVKHSKNLIELIEVRRLCEWV